MRVQGGTGAGRGGKGAAGAAGGGGGAVDPALAAAKQKAWNKAVFEFTATAADFARVVPGICAMYNIAGVKKHDGFAGWCGVIVGVVGVYKVWGKTA